MYSKYDGVKFYSKYDWSIREHLAKAAIILEEFDENKKYVDCNKIIELYNIQKLINSGVALIEWDEEKINHYKKLCGSFLKVIGKFFGNINDENFRQICQSVWIEYMEDFWKLFVKFRAFKRVSGQEFSIYISNSGTSLQILLQQEELVKTYGRELTDILRSSDQTPQLIIGKFLQKHNQKPMYNFPKELSPLEYEKILQKYLKLNTANLNDLQLLAYAQSTKECPISDKLRLSARRACNTYLETHSLTSVQIGYGIGVEFADIPEIKSNKRLENNTFQITYDIKWLLENLDYPTILNNFHYIFEQFDDCWRSTLVSVKSQLGIFEETLAIRGIKEFIKGEKFNIGENLSTMQVKGCYDILKSHGVRLEDVFKWFFEEYLPQEFSANGFQFNPPSEGTTVVEKCRTIASEMDGILKQFRMYVQNGEIDRELFEMSSEHIVFSNIPGYVKEKYAYRNSSNIQKEEFLLFSDQSFLGYIEKNKNRYRCFWKLLIHEDVKISDFGEHQKIDIQWLIERDLVRENSDDCLKLNISKVFILKDLYEHDVICPQYYDSELKNIIDEWCGNGDLRLGDTLFLNLNRIISTMN